ncbi:hypothetical protein DFH06DRAFT_435774 [Mycena polygramma]|nr:hypothetical protein DFH06DRAFT_435774 [Mycena polygramma]
MRQEMTPKPRLLLVGLTHLAKIPVDLNSQGTVLTVAATLSYIAAQDDLLLPGIGTGYLTHLELLSTELGQLESWHSAFPPLSCICIRCWSLLWSVPGEGNWTSLSHLLNAIRLMIQTNLPAGSTITQWISVVFDHRFTSVVNRGSINVLGAMQELVLSFRQVYNDGLCLSEAVAGDLDILTVRMCPPEVVCTIMYNGAVDALSEQNINWWGSRLGQDKAPVSSRLCDLPPLPTRPSQPQQWQITSLRIICVAGHSWFQPLPHNNCEASKMILLALPHVVSACC